MNVTEKLREMVKDYESMNEFNSKLANEINEDVRLGKMESTTDDIRLTDEGLVSPYQHATSSYDCIYSKAEAKLIDAVTIPFDVKVKEQAFSRAMHLEECINENGVYTYRGHDKQYYERLREDTNRKISEQDDHLEKMWLIEKYGKELLEASKFFELVEAIELIKDGSVRRYCETLHRYGPLAQAIYDEGFREGMLEAAKDMVKNDYPAGKVTLEDIAKATEVDIEKLRELAGEKE